MSELPSPYDLPEPAGLTDAHRDFLTRGMAGLELTPGEQSVEAEIVRRGHDGERFAEAALLLGMAFLLYRKVLSRRLGEELTKLPPTPTTLQLVATVVWRGFLPHWLGMVIPALLLGYRQGLREAKTGQLPDSYLYDIASGYAENLGEHINQVSAEAMIGGFNAQVNRKVPPARAASRVAAVYGVPPRTMNALVSVWTTEEPKKLTQLPMAIVGDTRARALAEKAHLLRAEQIGQSESWNAKSMAKQIVWMYGESSGALPKGSKRTWITAADEKVCPACGPLHEVTAPVNVQFASSLGHAWSPPLHVNCRCDVILDTDVTADMESELYRLIESEPISKDAPGDPYDRDEQGRFSETEQRHAQMLRRLRDIPTEEREPQPQPQRAPEPVQPEPRPYAEPIAPIPLDELREKQRAAEEYMAKWQAARQYMKEWQERRATERGAERPGRLERLSTERLGERLQAHELGKTPERMRTPIQRIEAVPLRLTIQVPSEEQIRQAMPERLKARIERLRATPLYKPVPLPQALYTYLEKDQLRNKEEFTVDVGTFFTEDPKINLPGELDRYWRDVKNDILRLMSEEGNYGYMTRIQLTDPRTNTSRAYTISSEDVEHAINAAIAKDPPRPYPVIEAIEDISEEELMSRGWNSNQWYERDSRQITATQLGYLLKVLGKNLHEYVEDREPYIVRITDVLPENYVASTKMGYPAVIGNYRITPDVYENLGESLQHSYKIHHAEPM